MQILFHVQISVPAHKWDCIPIIAPNPLRVKGLFRTFGEKLLKKPNVTDELSRDDGEFQKL
jgi:hypothetical protein